MPKAEQILTVLDVGSAKTCAVVAEVNDGGLRYRGHGVCDSRGTRKGVIVDLEKAAASIQRAVEQAEKAAGLVIDSALLGIGGPHVRGVNSRGGVHPGRPKSGAQGSSPTGVNREDIRGAVEKARSVTLPPDRQVLHLLPQEFILDEQPGIHDPAGMLGSKLEVKVHLVTASATATQNTVTAANRAGVQVDDTVFEALAAAEATLKSDERELGVCLADIGAGSTDVLVVHEGVVAYSASMPIGGDHFTSDLAVGLRTPLTDAEKIKRLFGYAKMARVPEGNEVEVPAVGARPSRLLPQRFLAEILEPRARELMDMLGENLSHAGVLELCAAGVVLTGGGARLLGLANLAEGVLRKPVRVGYPAALSKMPATLAEPEFAVPLGMTLYGHRARLARAPQERGLAAKVKALLARATS